MVICCLLPVPYSIFPLGDSAITIDLGNCIDEQFNRRAIALHDWLQAHRFPGIRDVIVAYSSVSVHYDPGVVLRDGVNGVIYYGMERWLMRAWEETSGVVVAREDGGMVQGHFFRIPVCYEGEYAPDLEWVAKEKGLSRAAVIDLHCAVTYRVYMVGFLPGFPYLGRTDPRLEIGRKKQPAPVVAGGVGIAGFQSGIYPLDSPGGWQIIGRTPLAMFNSREDPPIHLQPGDSVQFYSISEVEFRDWGH